MLRKIQEWIYNTLARYTLCYPFLFKVLKLKGFLDKRFDKVIVDYCRDHNNFFFVQIGANDGIKADSLYLYARKYGWGGLLVEPVPYLFKKLVKNYAGLKGITFENTAIAEMNGSKFFYHLKQNNSENLPLWYDEIGSFEYKNVLKHQDKIPNIKKYIIKDKVKCMTFESLISKNKIKKIDFLHIDTEGYDYKILKQINFNKLKPSMIIYEDRHLSNKEKNSARKILLKQGYTILQLPGDSFAYTL